MSLQTLPQRPNLPDLGSQIWKSRMINPILCLCARFFFLFVCLFSCRGPFDGWPSRSSASPMTAVAMTVAWRIPKRPAARVRRGLGSEPCRCPRRDTSAQHQRAALGKRSMWKMVSVRQKMPLVAKVFTYCTLVNDRKVTRSWNALK